MLLAWGEGKAPILKQTIEGGISEQVPATYLQNHPNAEIILDDSSSAELTRVKTPWLVGPCNWNDRLIRKGIVWLCMKVKKPILKLTDRDYNDNGMSDLIAETGTAHQINIKVFNELQHTITGWPGGKPNTDDSQRPERAKPFPKRVIVFSPHPDDDVICMGGTLTRLVDHGHEVHVAYQTSGNIAVFDDDVVRHLDFMADYIKEFFPDNKSHVDFYNKAIHFLKNKKPLQADITEVQQLKGLIRMGEARAACRSMGVNEENIHYLNLPFYETGRIKKNELSADDINIIINLLKNVKPHQVYASAWHSPCLL